jgi:hypothetical protein
MLMMAMGRRINCFYRISVSVKTDNKAVSRQEEVVLHAKSVLVVLVVRILRQRTKGKLRTTGSSWPGGETSHSLMTFPCQKDN